MHQGKSTSILPGCFSNMGLIDFPACQIDQGRAVVKTMCARYLRIGSQLLSLSICTGHEHKGHIFLVLEHADMDMEMFIWKHQGCIGPAQAGFLAGLCSASCSSTCGHDAAVCSQKLWCHTQHPLLDRRWHGMSLLSADIIRSNARQDVYSLFAAGLLIHLSAPSWPIIHPRQPCAA